MEEQDPLDKWQSIQQDIMNKKAFLSQAETFSDKHEYKSEWHCCSSPKQLASVQLHDSTILAHKLGAGI